MRPMGDFNQVWQEYHDKLTSRAPESLRPPHPSYADSEEWQEGERDTYHALTDTVWKLLVETLRARNEAAREAVLGFLDYQYGEADKALHGNTVLSEEARRTLGMVLASDFCAWSSLDAGLWRVEVFDRDTVLPLAGREIVFPRNSAILRHDKFSVGQILQMQLTRSLETIEKHLVFAKALHDSGLDTAFVTPLLSTLRLNGVLFGSTLTKRAFDAALAKEWLDDLLCPDKRESYRLHAYERKHLECVDESSLLALQSALDTDEKCTSMWSMYVNRGWPTDYEALVDVRDVVAALLGEEGYLDALAGEMILECGQHHVNTVIMAERREFVEKGRRKCLFMGFDEPLAPRPVG